MELKNQVCSLELAKKLKELGVKQESLFSWICEKCIKISTEWENGHNDKISAFTVAELGEMLPDFYYSYWCFQSYRYGVGRGNKHYECARDGEEAPPFTSDDTEADARAKMLIYLLENKLMTLPKE